MNLFFNIQQTTAVGASASSTIVSNTKTVPTTIVPTTTVPTTTAPPTNMVGVSVNWVYSNGVTNVTMKINNFQTSQWLAMGLSLDQSMVKKRFFCKMMIIRTKFLG
jgi:hypothetical protein